MRMTTLTILGCGGSAGVPAIGNQWRACDPMDTRNHRLRPSAVVRSAETTIMIDTGPDFRQQLNRTGITKIDAVLYSHFHGDHINGFEELRVIRNKGQGLIPIYADPTTQTVLKTRYPHMFETKDPTGFYPLPIEFKGWEPQDTEKQHKIGDISVSLVPMIHGEQAALGYRFNDTAYCTDLHDLTETGYQALENVKTLIIDCNNMFEHHRGMHLNFEAVQEINARLKCPDVILTHLKNTSDYKTTNAQLPDGYRLAYDGMELAL